MTRDDAEAFARDWIAAWNRRDIEWVLGRYAEDCVFTSPKAAVAVGAALVEGKAALRRYWQAGAARVKEFGFSLDRVTFDADKREVVVVYVSRSTGTPTRAIEVFRFRQDGRVGEAEAWYGATLAP